MATSHAEYLTISDACSPFNVEDLVMWHREDETIMIGKGLRRQRNDITQEPLPRRWVELIRYLNEQERKLTQSRDGPER
jgi:hypothetical protein